MMQHAFETMQKLAEDADLIGLHDLAEVYQASADRLFEEKITDDKFWSGNWS